MERHALSNQLFVPLDVDHYLILVARDDGADRPDFQTLRAFRVSGRQAINYFAGTWHMNMSTLDRPGVFIMMIHEDGTPDDCEFCDVDPVVIKLDVRSTQHAKASPA
jgi:ureidoglycolate lyase